MTSEDFITIVMLVLGLFLVAILLILIKQGKLKLEMWPRLLGIGAGAYMLISSMVFSIFLRPISKFVDYTISNILWSLTFGIIGYLGGRIIVRRAQNKK